MTSRKSEIASIAVIGVAAILLVVVVARLFALRFERGDAYPAYSSLRADPLGTMAFYDSIERCEGMSVRRSSEEKWELEPAEGTTILSIGNDGECAQCDLNSFELGKLARNGGRIVITYMPRNVEEEKRENWEKTKDGKDTGDGKKWKGKGAVTNNCEMVSSLTNDYPVVLTLSNSCAMTSNVVRKSAFVESMNVYIVDFPVINDASSRLVPDVEDAGLPAKFSCHSSACFTNIGTGWTTLYRRQGRAIMIESKVGKGSIVLSAETYFLSNEALKDERHPALLTWMLGGATNIVFDESHHSMGERKSMMDLIREYGLAWTLAVAGLLALMFIWKNVIPLVPSSGPNQAGVSTASVHSGRDSTSGLENLLKRNIDARSALMACVEEWEKSFAGDPTKAVSAAGMRRIVRMEDDKPIGSRDYTRAYNDVALALKERRLGKTSTGGNK